jgi:hypothetical protein
MAATAVIVLAVSVPLFLTSNMARNESAQVVAEQSTTEKSAEPSSPANALAARSGQATPPAAPSPKPTDKTDGNSDLIAKNAPGPASITETASGIAAGAELSKKAELKQSADEAQQRKSESQASPAPTQSGAAQATQVAKTDADQNRQQQQPEKDAAQPAAETRVAARSDEERAKEKSERERNEKVEDAAAPPAPPSSSEIARGRTTLRRPGKLSLRDSGSVEAVRPEERKLSGKKFLFRDGAWTDKEYDPNKELPVVTIIRDSNVYVEVLSKRPGLKPYLAGFPATERAIIVYKGTVYKLIPQ